MRKILFPEAVADDRNLARHVLLDLIYANFVP